LSNLAIFFVHNGICLRPAYHFRS